ncbi:MAG: hypothetical protein HLX46_06125 [Corynebacterium sp.]|uniref:DUF6779 domain-containing protein n=1 Tax=Corynebacterium sp. TaxID=1720 RepID=UPI00182BE7B5|nr:DUF6779 domain-containing protein [Corynebacterium sp.]NWO16406.1 hypothetical protein [Corynebacterium sp.]
MTANDEEKTIDSERFKDSGSSVRSSDEFAGHDVDSYSNDDFRDDHSTGSSAGKKLNLDNGSIVVIVLVALAVIASIVMLIASSTAALKIALLAALWAAVGGIFLVTRYRNQVRDREEEMYVREDLYHAELDKLRAEAETNQALERLENSPHVDMGVLAEIRAELASIREQLEELSGREFTYVPAALQAEARRIMEIEARAKAAESNNSSYISSYGADADAEPEAPVVEFTQPSGGKPSADAIAGRIGNTPTYSRNDNPLAEFINEMNSESTNETPKKADKSSAAGAGGKTEAKMASTSAASAKADSKPAKPAEEKPKEFNTGSFQAVRWDTGGDDAAKTGAKHTEKAETAEVAEDDEPRRGRRRSDAHREGTVSVAELLAAAKKRQKDS